MVHVLQVFPSPMQPNQIFMHPNTMPVCAPQVFWLADWPEQNLFRLLFNCALALLPNSTLELINGSFVTNKFEQCTEVHVP